MKKLTYSMSKWGLALGALLLTVSCSEDKDDTYSGQISQTDVQLVMEADALGSVLDGVVTQAHIDGSSQTAKSEDSCYIHEFTQNGYTLKYKGCTVAGYNLAGSLSVNYAAEGETASFTVNYDNLTIDGTQISGSRSYELSGDSTDGRYTFSVVSDMVVTFEDGTTASEKGNKVYVLEIGDSLENSGFSVSGDWKVMLGDDTYTLSSENGLHKDLLCEYWTSGILKLSKNGLEVSVDFGDATCDDQALLVYPDGTEETISLD